MYAFAAAGAAFLFAVLWFDLMFDVQARGPGDIPAAALASISTYYRRVTLQARMMSRLVTLAMLATVVAIGAEIARGGGWAAWVSLAAALGPIGLAAVRIVPEAKRLGHGDDPPDAQARLARSIWRGHL